MSEKVLVANSPVQMAEVASLLLFGRTPKEIALELELPYDRVLRWQKDPAFMEVYEQVAVRLTEEVTAKAAEQYAMGIERLTPKAMRVLEEGMDSEKVSDRLNAAGKVLALRKKPASGNDTRVLTIEAQIRSRAQEQTLVDPAAGD